MSQVLEAAFKNETVGLVTREEFLNKRNTIKDRLQEEEEKRKREAEAEAAGRATVFRVLHHSPIPRLHSFQFSKRYLNACSSKGGAAKKEGTHSG